MFGALAHFAPPPPSEPPKDVPPPTPVNFPRPYPQPPDNAPAATSEAAADLRRKQPIARILQGIVRPTEISIEHFEALGLHVRPNASMQELIPDMSVVPDFAAWETTEVEEARRINDSTRSPLNNGNRSPGVQTYLDRKRELSIENNAAFRSIRRIQPPQGQPLLRLGNSYEFFRQLECFTTYWDDTSVTTPPPPPSRPVGDASPSSAPASASASPSKPDGAAAKTSSGEEGDGDGDSVSSTSSVAVTDSESKAPEKDTTTPEIRFYRTSTGSQMPPEARLNIISAFVKLVAYDFGCNVSPPRMEPRLYLNAISLPTDEHKSTDPKGKDAKDPKDATSKEKDAKDTGVVASLRRKGPCSYFSSGCVFVFRMALTREAARAGIVEGPVAAVSARHSTIFPLESEDGITENSTLDERRLAWSADKDACIDLARELVAALLTAQQRAREGRAECRIGEGEWWASKPRWGGGTGGPIGREVDAAPNTDEAVADRGEGAGGALGSPTGSSMSGGGGGGGGGASPVSPTASTSAAATIAAIRASRSGGGVFPGGIGGPALPSRSANKKQRKGLAIYDNYRMVRPPSSNWDKKTRYEAIGRIRGAEFDDIFIISALFHHMSIVRVRVPTALLEALNGNRTSSTRDWGKLEMVRSPWYDFFKADERLQAMRMTWAMLAFLMRKQKEEPEDVKMGDAA